MAAAILTDVIEVHLDEAAWLWTQWERALVAPDHDLSDTSVVEERLLAHVDGLVEGGAPVAEALLWPALESEDPPQVCAAVLALLRTGLPVQQLTTLLRAAASVQRPAVQRAMELHEGARLSEALAPLLGCGDAELETAVLEVLVFRDEAPDSVLGRFLRHEDARLLAAALSGLRAPSRTRHHSVLSAGFTSVSPAVRGAAIEAGLRAGLREAWEACRLAVLKSQEREPLVLWAMGCGEEEVASLVELLRAPERRADVLWALGFSGRVSAAEACLEWMTDAKVARLAGESFCSITGLRLEGPLALPVDELPEEELEADLTPRPENDLPIPDAEAIASWWHKSRGDFERGTRYLMGYPFQEHVLLTALERGPMRRRHVWARELAIRSKGTCQIATRALTGRQRAGLEQARALDVHLPVSPFARWLTR